MHLFLWVRLLEVKCIQHIFVKHLCTRYYSRHLENNSEQDTFVGLLETDDKQVYNVEYH